MKILNPDYERYLESQSHLQEDTAKARRGILSHWPKPDGLTEKWFRDLMKDIAPKTSESRKVLVLQVLRFLKRDKQVEAIKAIKLPKSPDSVTVEDLYTKEELDLIFRHAQNPRDRAMIQVLYEGALRAGELLSMNFKNVDFQEDGTATIIVKGKTGTRSIPLFASVPALKEWMNHHPILTGPVWVKQKRPFPKSSWSTIYLVVQTILKRANIKDKKKIVHMFRHTRITELVRLGVRGQSLHQLVGWTKKSNMEAVYVHLSTTDVENEVRTKVFGLDEDKEKYEPIIKPQKCPRCGEMNEPSARYCIKCNMPLSDDAMVIALQKQEQNQDEIERLVQERVNEKFLRTFTAIAQNIKSKKTLKDILLAIDKEMKRNPRTTDEE